MKKRLSINLLTSKIFWESMPLIISEIVQRGHYISIFNEGNIPSLASLLDCDVHIDLSAITDIGFYKNLTKEYSKRKTLGKKVPLMIDNPEAVMNSMDKRKTHRIMPDLVPESYNLNGLNNEKSINKFINDKYVVIKDPFGWWAKGLDRLSPQEALKKYKSSKNLIVQKYIPFSDGVGRILTLNYDSDFKIICAYLRMPNSWRTGEGTSSRYKLVCVSKKLYNFAKTVSIRSGIYLNGIDYI
jgi:glutathione synthase/RimK-type ligase-like ATP-grasp enzyme